MFNIDKGFVWKWADASICVMNHDVMTLTQKMPRGWTNQRPGRGDIDQWESGDWMSWHVTHQPSDQPRWIKTSLARERLCSSAGCSQGMQDIRAPNCWERGSAARRLRELAGAKWSSEMNSWQNFDQIWVLTHFSSSKNEEVRFFLIKTHKYSIFSKPIFFATSSRDFNI